jgi:hypothetical protein
MNAATAIAFPLISSVISVGFAYFSSRKSAVSLTFFSQAWRSARTIVFGNAVGSLAFGAYLSARVLWGSGETAYWLMPLIFAPFEYWSKFGLAIAGFAATSAFVLAAIFSEANFK